MKTRTHTQIISALTRAGIPQNCLSFVDGDFSLTTDRWIRRDFAEAFDVLLDSAGLKYQDQSWDCDNFSRLACAYAQILHNLTRPGISSLAFGEFAYIDDDVGGHDICVAILLVKGELEAAFYEPQPAMIKSGFNYRSFERKHLSKSELASCLFCRF